MAQKTFTDYKREISIIEVATHLGYKFDKSKGKTSPTFVLTDEHGREIDEIIIRNPKDPSTQGYFRHRSTGGDLISFIKENINSFSAAAGARNEIDAINRVLEHFAGVSRDFKIQEYLKEHNISNSKPFDPDRYEIVPSNIFQLMYFFKNRSINEETVKTFLPFIMRIKDRENKARFKNLAFPYRIPGKEEIVNFEIRGFGSFKSQAEGGNSSEALWLADFTGGKPEKATHFYLAESAYDIMSFYQVNKNKIDLSTSVFGSTGGSFSEKQLTNLTGHYPNARPVLCFDNDIAGKMYDIRASIILSSKEIVMQTSGDVINFKDKKSGTDLFSIEKEKLSLNAFREKSKIRDNVKLEKPPKGYKDWNEVLSTPMSELNKIEQIEKNKLNYRR